MAVTHSDVYYRHYANQLGGSFAVFKGDQYQTGDGLGDILKSVARWILPIFAPAAATAASKFVSTAADAFESGKSFKESAKAALKPAIQQGLVTSADRLVAKMAQKGSGRRRRRTGKASRQRRRKVYKRKSRKRSKGSGTHRRRKVRVLPINF